MPHLIVSDSIIISSSYDFQLTFFVAALTVRIFPIEPQVVEGSTLNLTCEVNVSPPGDPVQISWRSIGSMDICSSRAECVGNTAVIRDFRQEDGGVYICEATSSSQIVSDLTTVMFKCEFGTI